MDNALADYSRNVAAMVNKKINGEFTYNNYAGKTRSMDELKINGGKCADYVKQKALKLLAMGYGAENMKMGIGYYGKQPHSVLLFQPPGQSDPIVLDNVDGTAKPLSERPDIKSYEKLDLPPDWHKK